ncbi:alpha/beta fold hydrolase [Acidipila sp. EB88]|uniref:alpha/beta fold hydrolase n=1 Tax=Acidipila sp. EB88 TaxID=2305226 RepID=UPI000F5F133D|nr:alpha/beta fold hydrolase [Acidipila sp. EB88]RRA47691.1 alpha/beta fold hydrolase [Acidipila sp. EB88]
MNRKSSNVLAETQINWIRTSTDKPATVVLVHAVGYDLTYWDRQIEALREEFNVVAFDLPGHGNSSGAPGEWSFEYAAAVTAKLIEEVSVRPVHLVGISFGGMIAQMTTLERPELVRSLTLIGTGSHFSQDVRRGMRTRAEAVRAGGMATVTQSSLERWFTPKTRMQRPDITDRVTKTLLADDPATHAAIWDVISTLDIQGRLGEILCPTLVLVGERDPSTPPSVAHGLAAAIQGSKLVIIPDAAHIITVEAPTAVNEALKAFLKDFAD